MSEYVSEFACVSGQKKFMYEKLCCRGTELKVGREWNCCEKPNPLNNEF